MPVGLLASARRQSRAGLLRLVATGVALIVVAGGAQFAAPPATVGAAPAACASTAPNEAAAMATARSCGRRVEVMSSRTDTVQVLADADGTTWVEESLVPDRVSAGGGGWTAADRTLVASNGAWVPWASSLGVMASNGGSGPFVTYHADGATLTLSWPLGSLPAPVVSGSAAEYPGVLPGVDL